MSSYFNLNLNLPVELMADYKGSEALPGVSYAKQGENKKSAPPENGKKKKHKKRKSNSSKERYNKSKDHKTSFKDQSYSTDWKTSTRDKNLHLNSENKRHNQRRSPSPNYATQSYCRNSYGPKGGSYRGSYRGSYNNSGEYQSIRSDGNPPQQRSREFMMCENQYNYAQPRCNRNQFQKKFMCENRYNYTQPWDSSYYHYMQEHAIMSNFIQELHEKIHFGGYPFHLYNPTNVYNDVDHCSCCCCQCCSCCSPENCSRASLSEYEEEAPEKEYYQKQQHEDENYDEDDSECEYEFNVDCILAMRAAKKELKEQEREAMDEESSVSEDEESSNSEADKERKSDSSVFIDSDQDDFELVDPTSTKALQSSRYYKPLGRFNRTEEDFNKRYIKAYLYGERSRYILCVEASMNLEFNTLRDKEQPSFWPVLPLRL